MSTISKTTIVFSVLHRTDEPIQSLEEALERADTGNAVGGVLAEHTAPVVEADVPYELRLLGNDGEFFAPDLDEVEVT